MLIGEVARRSGVPSHTIRFYEAQRLLTRPARRASGYRSYSDQVLGELGFIRRAQQLGFTLDDVREILTLGRKGTKPCGRVAAMCATHLERIDRQLAELQAFRRGLQEVARQATDKCGLTVEGFCRAIAGRGLSHAFVERPVDHRAVTEGAAGVREADRSLNASERKRRLGHRAIDRRRAVRAAG